MIDRQSNAADPQSRSNALSLDGLMELQAHGCRRVMVSEKVLFECG